MVEIARTAVKQLGINVTGNWNLLSTAAAGTTLNAFGPAIAAASAVQTGVIGGLTGSGSAVSGQAGFGNGNAGVGGTLSALERAGVSRTLAEPTLVAISGETASFQAGGEIPIVIQSCAGGICTPSVNYKATASSCASPRSSSRRAGSVCGSRPRSAKSTATTRTS